MNNALLKTILCFTAIGIISGCGPRGNLTVAEKRQKVMHMEQETLDRLYREAPETRERIKNAVGYGTFSNANVNIIFASAGGGYGVVVENATGKRTYMKMALGGIGFGLGVKDYRVVMIFKDKPTLDRFIESGWDLSAHADAAAKAGESGAEISVFQGEGGHSLPNVL